MKPLYTLIILLVFLISGVAAQTREWQWAKTETQPDHPTTNTLGCSVATDAAGNVVTTGYFYTDSITFGNYTLYNTDPTESSTDIFLVKYDPLGNVLWAVSAGGAAMDYGSSVTTDEKGNIYVVGTFNSFTASFGPFTVYNDGPTDTTGDIFVAKYNPAGQIIGVESFGGDYYDWGSSVATDASGNVFVAGYFCSDSLLFGPYMIHDGTGYGYANAFLMKLDSSGLVMWVSTGITPWGATANAVCTDPSGNSFLTGIFVADTIGFGTQTVQNQAIGEEDIFLVKYDPAGNVLWAQGAGGSSDDIPEGIAADARGNSYITGYFNSPSTAFGSQQIYNTTSDGNSDIFVAKFDPSGNAVWADGFGGAQNDVALSIAADTASNVYVAGYFYSTQMTLGSYTIENYDNSGNTTDIFVAQLDSNGNVVLALDAGGDYYDAGYGIATDHTQNIIVAGYYDSGDIAFGNNDLDNNTVNYGLYSFVAKYTSITTGITDPRQLLPVSLYPNPAGNMLIAQSGSFMSSEVAATVCDVTGAAVPVTYTVSNGRMSLEVHELADGMYWVRFDVNGNSTIGKFVKAGSGQ